MKLKFRMQVGLLLVGAGLLGSMTSCVKQGWVPCENQLRFVYDYNIDFVDKFHQQVTHLMVYAFDSQTGLFDHKFEVTGAPFAEKFEMEAPASLIGKNLDLVIWAGLDDGSYSWPELEEGVSKKEDLQVRLKEASAQAVGENKVRLEPLWHGSLDGVSYKTDGTGQVQSVSLTKNTNTFRLVIESLVPGYVATNDDFDIAFTSPNSWMGYDNGILSSSDQLTTYLPYYRTDDSKTGAVFEWNSLRLMEERTQTLIIKDKTTGKVLFDMPMNDYLNSLRIENYSQMPLQEYLDREDTYAVSIFILERGDQPEVEAEWLSVRISINGWVVREHDVNR